MYESFEKNSPKLNFGADHILNSVMSYQINSGKNTNKDWEGVFTVYLLVWFPMFQFISIDFILSAMKSYKNSLLLFTYFCILFQWVSMDSILGFDLSKL